MHEVKAIRKNLHLYLEKLAGKQEQLLQWLQVVENDLVFKRNLGSQKQNEQKK